MNKLESPIIESHVNKKGQFHRDDDLPAVIREDGTKEWWYKGKRHRDYEDHELNEADSDRIGYAIEYPNGDGEWWLKGKNVTNKVIAEEQWCLNMARTLHD